MENTALKKAGRLLEIIHDLPERYGYGSLVEEAIEAFTGMDYQKAASIFEEAIDEYGPDKELWCCLAFAYIFDGEIDSGIECLSNYADLEDDDEKRELAESLIVDLESKMIMEESSREILAALERGEDVDVDEIMKEAGEEEEVKVNPDIFREYDIRGVADVDLKSPFVRLLGETLGIYFREKGESRVLVGRDNRLSGARIRDALVEGLTSVGCDVYDIGVVITPIFYYARISKGINAGVMITASHNPTEYNGFKVALGSATIHGEEIKEVGRRVEERAKELALGIGITAESTKPGKVFEVDAVEDYLSMITDKIKLGDRKLKVVVDCGNGTAGLFVERYLHSLGCEVIPLYCESDPTFPNHHPDPVKSSNLTDMIKVVKKSKADVGIGFDGDGDRIGVVDDKGEII